MSDIGVAIIGYGLAGAVFHAPLIAATPGLRVRAVVTASPERRRQALEDFPDVRLLATADEPGRMRAGSASSLWRRRTTSTPPKRSPHWRLGLTVVVDKPLALDTAEAVAMLAVAERTGGLLAVFHNRRWDSDFLLLRKLVEEDRLGGLHRIEARFERYRPELRSGTWRAEATSERGGGLLLDLGSHLIDQALVLLGRPDAVYGEVACVRPGAIADDDCFLALHFPGGAHAHLWMSDVAPAAGPRWRAWGSRETLEVWGLDPQESQIPAEAAPGAPASASPTGGSAPPWSPAGSGAARAGTSRSPPAAPGASTRAWRRRSAGWRPCRCRRRRGWTCWPWSRRRGAARRWAPWRRRPGYLRRPSRSGAGTAMLGFGSEAVETGEDGREDGDVRDHVDRHGGPESNSSLRGQAEQETEDGGDDDEGRFRTLVDDCQVGKGEDHRLGEIGRPAGSSPSPDCRGAGRGTAAPAPPPGACWRARARWSRGPGPGWRNPPDPADRQG